MLIGEVRFSFARIFEPHVINDSAPKYSLTMLIPKSNTKLVQQIAAEMNAAAQAGLQKKFGGQLPTMLNKPIYDGDGVRPNGEKFGPECHGCYVMTASADAKYPPQVVAGQDKHEVMDQREVYSGCFGWVDVSFYAYNSHGRKGIGCGLNNVLKTRDGEPLAWARKNAQDAFSDIDVPAAAPSTAAPFSTPLNDDYAGVEIDPITGKVLSA